MPAALLRIGTKIVTGAISAWKKTQTARQAYSVAKTSLSSWYQQKEQQEPSFPVIIMTAAAFFVIVLNIIFPGLLVSLLPATTLIGI